MLIPYIIFAGTGSYGSQESGQHLLHEQHSTVPEQYATVEGVLCIGHVQEQHKSTQQNQWTSHRGGCRAAQGALEWSIQVCG